MSKILRFILVALLAATLSLYLATPIVADGGAIPLSPPVGIKTPMDPLQVFDSNLKGWWDFSATSTLIKGGYDFVPASTQNFVGSSLPCISGGVPQYPLSVVVWARTDTVAAGVQDLVAFDSNGGSVDTLEVRRITATWNCTGSHLVGSGGAISAASSAAVQWICVIGAFRSTTSRSIYASTDTTGATDTTSIVPSSLSRIRISGVNGGLGVSQYWDGRIAYATVLPIDLSDAGNATIRGNILNGADPVLASGLTYDDLTRDSDSAQGAVWKLDNDSGNDAGPGNFDVTAGGTPVAQNNLVVCRERTGNHDLNMIGIHGTPEWVASGIGGRGCADLEGGDTDGFTAGIASITTTNTSPITMYTVSDLESSGTSRSIISLRTSGTNNNSYTLRTNTADVVEALSTNNAGSQQATGVGAVTTLATPFLSRATFTSETLRNIRRGVGWWGSSTTSSSPASANRTSIGVSGNASAPYDGLVGEAFICGVDPIDAQDAEVVRFLDRWGLDLTPRSGWTPASLSGRLAANYAPENVQHSSGVVSGWNDDSGHAYHLDTESTPAPTYLGGTIAQLYGGVLFSDNDTQFLYGNCTPISDNSLTIYIVAVQVEEQSGDTYLSLTDKDTDGQEQYNLINASGDDGVTYQATAAGAQTQATVGATNTTDKSKISLITFAARSATDYGARLNLKGNKARSTTSRAVAGLDRVCLAQITDSVPSATNSIVIFHALIMEDFPTDSEDAQILGYLQRRYRFSDDGTNGRVWNPYEDLSIANRPTLLLDANIASSLSVSGGVVDLWGDAWGRAYSFTQTLTARPAFTADAVNTTVDCVDFDGTNDYLSSSTVYFSADTSGLMMALVQMDDDPGAADRELVCSSDTAASGLRHVSFGVAASNNATSFPTIKQFNNDTEDCRRGPTNPAVNDINFASWGSSSTGYFQTTDAGTPSAQTAVSGADTGDWFADTTSLDNTVIGARVDGAGAARFHNGKLVYLAYYSNRVANDADQDPLFQLIRAWMANTTAAY